MIEPLKSSGRRPPDDLRNTISLFLTSQRSRIRPEKVGIEIPDGRRPRRVPGLRRSEVAELSGISLDYYIRMERGDLSGISREIIDSVSQTLHLDQTKRHYFQLLHQLSNNAYPPNRALPIRQVRPALQIMLNAMALPAWIINTSQDVVASNAYGRALYSPMFDLQDLPINQARFALLDPAARTFWREYEQTFRFSGPLLRRVVAENYYDPVLMQLIDELVSSSILFNVGWSTGDAVDNVAGIDKLHHPLVGDLDLNYEVMALEDTGLFLVVYFAEPGSESEQRLFLLRPVHA